MVLTFSVVIVHHQEIKRLRACLDSIDRDAEIIVVDTSPTTESRTMEVSRVPRILPRPENRGYGWACNEGLRASSGEIKVVCNSDVVFQPGALDGLVDVSSRLEVMVAPLQTHRGRVSLDNLVPELSATSIVSKWLGLGRRALNAERQRLLSTLSERPLLVPDGWGLSGAVVAARGKDWTRLAGFDERLWMYYEDVDLSSRAKLAGISLLLSDCSRVAHTPGTLRRGPALGAITAGIWSEQILSRDKPGQWLSVTAVQFIGTCSRALVALLRGNAGHALVWWRAALASLKRVYRDPRT